MGDDKWERLADYDLGRIANALERLVKFFTEPPVAKSLTVQILDSKGNIIMPATVTVGGTFTAVAQEWSGLNGTGVQMPPAGAIGWTSSDTTVATVDPVSGKGVAVGPGKANIVALDSVNGLTGFDIVSDVPVVAQSLTVNVTTP